MNEVSMDLTCSTSCYKMCDHAEGSSIVTGEINWLTMDSSPCSTPYGTPIFSRENSFSSFSSCLSSLAYENISPGYPQLETFADSSKGKFDATDITSDLKPSSEHHQDMVSSNKCIETICGVSVEDIDLKQSGVMDVEEVTSLPMPGGGGIIPLNEHVMDQLDSTMENAIVYNNISNTQSDMKHGADFDNENGCLYPLVLPSFDADPLIWLPPEPENKEDDIDTVFNNCDESEDNSTGWGRSSFNINLSEKSKESREVQLQKVMSEVMNGQFKILVSRFLAAEGFSLSDGGTDKNWLDIVVSLSWDAALLVKPDANSGNAMDPGFEVINGLVFKKGAAHKQMRSNVKRPKLLLLQGALGYLSTGLSSINSMKQENEQLEKTISEVIGKCQPDVILLEKAVSRNTVLTKSSLLKQCESLHFEKFVEEHNITGEDGRKPCKTLLFLEGFPRPLGCTILLKGATREELKKIKRVLHFTVFAAYHLILETSFFADQKLFTTDKITTEKEKCFETNQQRHGPYYDSSENSDSMKHSIPTFDDQCTIQEKLINTEKSIPLHTGKHTDSNGILSYPSPPVSDPSTNFKQDTSSSGCAESNSCDDFDGSTFTDTSKEVHKKQLSGEKFQETAEGIYVEDEAALNTQDILISMSSQHIRKQAVCEQNHLSRITYYGYFDTSLGRYLQDTLLNEVFLKWKQLFSEIENFIQDLRSRYSTQAMGEDTNVSVHEGLLLEVYLKVFSKHPVPESFPHEIIGLNWLYQQLLLGFYIWDLRLLHILQYTEVNTASSEDCFDESAVKNELKHSGSITIRDALSVKTVGMERKEETVSSSGRSDNPCANNILDTAQLTDKPTIKEHALPIYQNHDVRSSLSSPVEVVESGSHHLKTSAEKSNDLPFTNHEQLAASKLNETYQGVIPSDDAGKWVWNRFSHLEMEYKKEFQDGSLDKFHLINKFTPCSSALTQLKHQMDLGHFIVDHGGNILSIAEEEVSSSIAYALTMSEQEGFYSEAACSSLDRNASMFSSMLPPDESSENKHNFSRFASQISSEESGFYYSFLSALKDLHPEIDLNNEKIVLRRKYTVGGKSKVFFAKSMDDRFIIKQIKKTEFDSFLKFGLEYFKHLGVSQVSRNPTCLAKILGIYQVKETRNGKETSANFMVMENLLYGHNILRRYDLKGALFSRYVPDSENPEKVLLDQNFIEDMRTMPIYIEGKTKILMERAIWNDTAFLSLMNVMDYSLFVGVDKQKKELVFGIIDYLRQYTWGKQLESWVKTSLVVPKNLSPTVISPREYKLRFRSFMSQYFLSVPDA
ncbi:hypothetical protein HU200_026282 [Digitaria exilis]|uniref:PIPK domain-containing protein n=1 Tax=Digitaria exilis TaxID=1010633 RepID=A0A835EVQ0_9POAL|nr:hypothetical protein HU200_026282 [Digitaria exilis]